MLHFCHTIIAKRLPLNQDQTPGYLNGLLIGEQHKMTRPSTQATTTFAQLCWHLQIIGQWRAVRLRCGFIFARKTVTLVSGCKGVNCRRELWWPNAGRDTTAGSLLIPALWPPSPVWRWGATVHVVTRSFTLQSMLIGLGSKGCQIVNLVGSL